MPHAQLSSIYSTIGQFEKSLDEARELLRVNDTGLFGAYDGLALAYINEAKAKNQASLNMELGLYMLAFLENDTAGMEQQVRLAAGKPAGGDGRLQFHEAQSAAFAGQLRKSQEFSRRAVSAAEGAGYKESAAFFEAVAALREARFGLMIDARHCP